MTLLHLFLLAAVQGITEFLPISSSAHLILLPRLLGMPDQGLALDVAVHVGTLAAVILYFRSDVAAVISGLGRLARGQADTPGARLALLLCVATVPVVLAGFALKLSGAEAALRSITVIGWATLGFGLLLWLADRRGREDHRLERWSLRHAIVLGLWQAVALIPGTSRSGIVITGARILGYERHNAARISMLMSIPTIAASGVLLAGDVAAAADWALLREGAMAAAMACVAALAALALMMRLIASVSFTPYVIYRVILGVVLLWIAYT